MPDLMDRLYCSEQIHIPPTFPFIMKLYCKAAIRTQPYDLLKWSAAYFRALANGEEPPVKDRIEYPPYDSPTGLTPGYIRMLIKQLGKDPETTVSAQTLFIKWNCVCLEDELLVKIIALMGATTSVEWLKFVAVAAGYICSTLTNTMILICELLTDEPEGGMATIPLDVFNDLYMYLASMECGPLSEDELKALEGMEVDEDVSVVAEKIRTAIFAEDAGEGEAEGPFIPEMLEETGEAEYVGEMSVESEGSPTDDVKVVKDKRVVEEVKVEVKMVDAKSSKAAEVEEEGEFGEQDGGSSVDDEDEDDDFDGQSRKRGISNYEGSKETIKEDATSEDLQSELQLKDIDASSHTVMDDDVTVKEEPLQELEGKTRAALEDRMRKEEKGKAEEAEKEKFIRKINLEDFEPSIRLKIEEKLGAEEESEKSDHGFEELGSYLLDAAGRVKKYTAEEIGFRIFRRYMRQEVPGIGPTIDKSEVEKVIDFMDYNSHKQEGMVMPRNIRHWMCPPLDKVPLPEP